MAAARCGATRWYCGASVVFTATTRETAQS
jgi:hypothetical protein